MAEYIERDVVEVVRCRNCTHVKVRDMFGVQTILECRGFSVQPDDFCSRGKRKDGD